MKKFTILLMTFIISLSSSAQQSSHLQYEGVPLDGTLQAFTSQLHGYEALSDSSLTVLLSGSHDGKGCRLLVERLPDQDLVWGLTVIYPSCNDWPSLLDCYNGVKASCRKLYGKPLYSDETFLCGSQYAPTLLLVMAGDCYYKTVYNAPGGLVDVAIWYDPVNGCCVLSSFIDQANSELLSNTYNFPDTKL